LFKLCKNKNSFIVKKKHKSQIWFRFKKPEKKNSQKKMECSFDALVESVREELLKNPKSVFNQTKTVKAQEKDIPRSHYWKLRESYLNRRYPLLQEKLSELRCRQTSLIEKYEQLLKEEDEMLRTEINEIERQIQSCQVEAIHKTLERINKDRTKDKGVKRIRTVSS
jgi:hypothetical protein